MTHREFLDFIEEFINGGFYPPPRRYYRNLNFEFEALKRWAIMELRYYVCCHTEMRPIDGVVKFREMMNQFSLKEKTETTKHIFSVAYDVATDILDHML